MRSYTAREYHATSRYAAGACRPAFSAEFDELPRTTGGLSKPEQRAWAWRRAAMLVDAQRRRQIVIDTPRRGRGRPARSAVARAA